MIDLDIPGFAIRERVGKGGMAEVYLAEDQHGLQVAIKVIDTSQARGAELSEQFAAEAGIIGRLRHSSLIRIYRAGQHRHWCFLVSEYLPGGDLKARIKRGMSVDEALDLTRKLTGALDVAHEAGLVHRDVKPENVLFRANGVPVLMDFGIAAASGEVRGGMSGTPLYMSPEQVNAGAIDRRTDIYSLGAMLFEMLTGTPPYPMNTMEAILYAQVHRPVPELPEDLRELQGLIEGMMCKDVVERIGSSKELLSILDDYWLLAPRAAGTSDAAGASARRVWRDASSGRLVQARAMPGTAARSTAEVARDTPPARKATAIALDDGATALLAAAGHAVSEQDEDHDPLQEGYELARSYLSQGDMASGRALLTAIASGGRGEFATLAREMLYQLSR